MQSFKRSTVAIACDRIYFLKMESFQGGCMLFRKHGEEKRGMDTFLLSHVLARTLTLIVVASILSLLGEIKGNAQVLYGSIVGTVTDSSGSLVPAANVKATQTETNETRTTTTNQSGVYTLSTLPAGTYIVRVSKSGFETLANAYL
jgi:Carboxypeptidase regulatory-like domain